MSKELLSYYETYYGTVMPPPLKEFILNPVELDPEKLYMRLNEQRYRIKFSKGEFIERHDGLYNKGIQSWFGSKFGMTSPIIFADLVPENKEANNQHFYLAIFPLKVSDPRDFVKLHDTTIPYPVYLCYGTFESGIELYEEYDEEGLEELQWGLQKVAEDFREFITALAKS